MPLQSFERPLYRETYQPTPALRLPRWVWSLWRWL